jgi:hypothetical protein
MKAVLIALMLLVLVVPTVSASVPDATIEQRNPVLLAQTSGSSVSGTSHTLTYPSTINSTTTGFLWLAIVTSASTTITLPSGWTQVAGIANTIFLRYAYKYPVGTESGTTFVVTTSGSVSSAWIIKSLSEVYRTIPFAISDTAFATGNIGIGTSTTPGTTSESVGSELAGNLLIPNPVGGYKNRAVLIYAWTGATYSKTAGYCQDNEIAAGTTPQIMSVGCSRNETSIIITNAISVTLSASVTWIKDSVILFGAVYPVEASATESPTGMDISLLILFFIAWLILTGMGTKIGGMNLLAMIVGFFFAFEVLSVTDNQVLSIVFGAIALMLGLALLFRGNEK